MGGEEAGEVEEVVFSPEGDGMFGWGCLRWEFSWDGFGVPGSRFLGRARGGHGCSFLSVKAGWRAGGAR